MVDRGFQHIHGAIGQNRHRQFAQGFQRRVYVFKCGREKICSHQPVQLRLVCMDVEFSEGRSQRRFRYIPKVFVSFHKRSEPGVFELALPPRRGKSTKVSNHVVVGMRDDRVDIEQSAIGVENDSSWFHAVRSFQVGCLFLYSKCSPYQERGESCWRA
jgi:hypothetical protein